MAKLETTKRLAKAKVKLSGDSRTVAFGPLIMSLPMFVTDDNDLCRSKTACTDGYNCWYYKKFVDDLCDAQLRYLIVHEVLHVVADHLKTWQPLFKKDARCTNMATDHFNNLTMKYEIDPSETFLKPIKGALCDDKYRVNGVIQDTKKIFDDLYKQAKRKGKGEGNGETSSSDSQEEGQQSSDGNDGQALDDHLWDKAEEISKDKDKTKDIKEIIDTALRQGRSLAEKMSGNKVRSIDKVLEPKIDWREMLRVFLTNYNSDREKSSWRRPNRRWIHQDIYLPSLVSESAGKLVIGVDTSASIYSKVSWFLAQVVKIVKDTNPESIELVYWDTEIVRSEIYKQEELENILSSTVPRGGGGTDPTCVPKYIKNKNINPQCVVMFTDGYVGGWGKWDCPVFWGITSDDIVADVGTSVYVDID